MALKNGELLNTIVEKAVQAYVEESTVTKKGCVKLRRQHLLLGKRR